MSRPTNDDATLVVSHLECPGLLQHWYQSGVLSQRLSMSRTRAWFTGGSRDWDGREYQRLFDLAPELLYIRTQEASTDARDGASGRPSFRVVDVNAGYATPMNCAPGTDPRRTPSLPVGRLQTRYLDRPDGTSTRLALIVENQHSFPLSRLATDVLIQGTADDAPWVIGGRLLEAAGSGGVWHCRVQFDLPDRGAAQLLIGSGPKPDMPNIDVTFEFGERISFLRHESPDGVTYLSAPSDGRVRLHNSGKEEATVTPMIRLDGCQLAYRPADREGPQGLTYRLTLQPGQTTDLSVDLSAVRVRSGRRTLQVYFPRQPAWHPFTHTLDIETVAAPPFTHTLDIETVAAP
jgi:hypothetical protein